ncbi:hypothetical protein [Leptospira sarikeiensis]|uniref:DUF1554 domain-containing protein n=1 Tax=Leptospira sarikeiensis TaxID=2484943 RepID=A0A4R9K9I4_9LEPT|nr:hypothetical protein [Leptospira sarikeiensis]TGL61403.1 hypothetical protein EHQ64_10470 [Leptospira sarikeiensis]
MFYRLFLILFFSFSLTECITDKTCSDEDRSCSVEALILSKFSAPSGIYVYSSSATYKGNLAILGTGTLDASLHSICQNDRLLAPIIDQNCQSVAPLVSTSAVPANDLNLLYADLPYNGVAIRGPFGALITQEMSTLFSSGDLQLSLSAAGLGDSLFWSFGTGNGGYAADDCNGGTDSTSGSLGQLGSPKVVTQGSWFATDILSCSQSHRILCICYVPPASGSGATEG